jgi:peroxiredoxin
MPQIKPRQPVPDLQVETLDAGSWRLADQTPRHFTMLVFYRGLHCPICKSYLRDLNGKIPEFTARGVEAIAISCDDRERAERTKREWGLDRLRIGYGLTIPKAREWGLFISRGIKEGEPAEFSEPGLFLVKPDGTLYASAVNSMPFSRPTFADVLNAVDFVTRNNYPARGEA